MPVCPHLAHPLYLPAHALQRDGMLRAYAMFGAPSNRRVPARGAACTASAAGRASLASSSTSSMSGDAHKPLRVPAVPGRGASRHRYPLHGSVKRIQYRGTSGEEVIGALRARHAAERAATIAHGATLEAFDSLRRAQGEVGVYDVERRAADLASQLANLDAQCEEDVEGVTAEMERSKADAVDAGSRF